ncbi:3-isopropylmalate dehydratase small subunit [Acidocella aminolytica]|uniref:3-isopropylmalate dehydratase small subunit n=1 Tax=Acidocella aminolytica 101 = DSM 11237 TaxID=1120923 RepID=A0A0D6PGP1_9PROT|nr:3-isopropylmalate dehydratase small subunit [Acidocella aminolytica]GAN80546.1 isopropylmalate isomerase/3-isopropylmalate dehydratase small subunit leuD [Acidocella aminolytica 101 = DSM 11237]GBQ43029.1 3-isopropylmalate dehydratase small subunit [Acidocella aminolytica 101 = DSM 11237]SHE29152.1 3-isopropylmalate/(R)-2-methylmalate dehydratase small subunit [Acidocella aminolytica 101 = DSM 11237]
MDPFIRIEGRAYPLGRPNIDTDTIIAAKWLKTISRKGLGKAAFETVRSEPGNVFNDPRFKDAPIIIAGENFGCGSSREHAAWAMIDMGIRVIIAPSFSDIFAGNAFRNGILTVTLSEDQVNCLLRAAEQQPITVDLETCTIATPSDWYRFEIEPFRQDCLLKGFDEIAITLELDVTIAVYEAQRELDTPWIFRKVI